MCVRGELGDPSIEGIVGFYLWLLRRGKAESSLLENRDGFLTIGIHGLDVLEIVLRKHLQTFLPCFSLLPARTSSMSYTLRLLYSHDLWAHSLCLSPRLKTAANLQLLCSAVGLFFLRSSEHIHPPLAAGYLKHQGYAGFRVCAPPPVPRLLT